MYDLIENSLMWKVVCKIGLFFVLLICILLSAELSFAAIETNKIVSIQVDSVKGNPSLRIVTEKSIGYRYTVYDSNDLTRVVITFPHMDVDAVSSLTNVNLPPVQKVDVSSHDEAWGKMGRVEVVLSEMTDYDVIVNGRDFVLTLLLKGDQITTATADSVSIKTALVTAPPLKSAEGLKHASVFVSAPVEEVTASASTIISVDIGAHFVTLKADGLVDNYKYFSLVNPERLVVDIYAVEPGFEARHFPLSDDFSRMRVGVYKGKLRFVFDASGKFPKYSVISSGESVVISWEADTSTAAHPLQ